MSLNPAWVTAGVALAAFVAQHAMWLWQRARHSGVYDGRLASVEKSVDELKQEMESSVSALRSELRASYEERDDSIREIKGRMEEQHDRIRHDIRDQNTMLTALIEERGRNDERHAANQRVLQSIERRLTQGGK